MEDNLYVGSDQLPTLLGESGTFWWKCQNILNKEQSIVAVCSFNIIKPCKQLKYLKGCKYSYMPLHAYVFDHAYGTGWKKCRNMTYCSVLEILIASPTVCVWCHRGNLIIPHYHQQEVSDSIFSLIVRSHYVQSVSNHPAFLFFSESPTTFYDMIHSQ